MIRKTALISAVFFLIVVSCLVIFVSFKHFNKLFFVREWFILLDYDPARSALGPEVLSGYDMAIVDPDAYSGSIPKDKPIMIAYVSVGEAESYRSYWKEISSTGAVIGPNPDWPENYFVDVRSPEWRETLLDKVIPDIVSKGYKGIMMDTIDTAEYLFSKDQDKYPGVKEAMVGLVRDIRSRNPGLILISNNGLWLMDDIGPYLDGMLVEDIFTLPDLKNGSYDAMPPQESDGKIKRIKQLSRKFTLPVFAVDYVRRDDKKKAEDCRTKLKRLGFKPYIAEPMLDRLYER